MFEPVIGLEVHLALKTTTKLFCGCLTSFGDEPNVNVCPVCLGLPGTLPRLNARALELALTFAAALGCTAPAVTWWDRKHYFYPDSPKNYQISQDDAPVGEGGAVRLRSGKRIGIIRCHLEEDAGRMVHPPHEDHSLVDLNRAGAPLVEMVTEPTIASGEEARDFLAEVRALARALGVSDAAPEEGKMRADVNISLRRPGEPFGVKVEVKNLNSFRSVAAAIDHEIRRQERLLETGREVRQETRGWNEGGQRTYLMRVKEASDDYRYLRDPDIAPVHLNEARLLEMVGALPELPQAKLARYEAAGVRSDHAYLLAYDAHSARFFDAVLEEYGGAAQGAANWMAEVAGRLHAEEASLEGVALTPQRLVELMKLVDNGTISMTAGKELLGSVMSGAEPAALVRERGLAQVSDETELAALVDGVIESNPELVERVRVNPRAINALLGEVMRASGGAAKPDAVRRILAERLA